jgi:hypothetical protein
MTIVVRVVVARRRRRGRQIATTVARRIRRARWFATAGVTSTAVVCVAIARVATARKVFGCTGAAACITGIGIEWGAVILRVHGGTRSHGGEDDRGKCFGEVAHVWRSS